MDLILRTTTIPRLGHATLTYTYACMHPEIAGNWQTPWMLRTYQVSPFLLKHGQPAPLFCFNIHSSTFKMRVSIISAVVGITALVSAAPVAREVADREAAPQIYGD